MEEKILLSRVTARLVLSKLARSTTLIFVGGSPSRCLSSCPRLEGFDDVRPLRRGPASFACPPLLSLPPRCFASAPLSLPLSVPTLRRRALCLLLLQRFLAQRSWSESCRGSLALSDFLALSRLSSACNTGRGFCMCLCSLVLCFAPSCLHFGCAWWSLDLGSLDWLVM